MKYPVFCPLSFVGIIRAGHKTSNCCQKKIRYLGTGGGGDWRIALSKAVKLSLRRTKKRSVRRRRREKRRKGEGRLVKGGRAKGRERENRERIKETEERKEKEAERQARD